MPSVQDIQRVKRGLLVVVCMVSVTVVYAQFSPLGIVSVQDTLRGMQLGVFSSVSTDNARGIQLSGVSNMSAAPFRGLQVAGVSNISRGLERGIQLSGILNVSSAYMRGLQWGTFNYADSLNGTQLGLVNIARSHPKGWQVGFANVTRDTVGRKIGLININPNTVIDYMVYAGTSSKLNTAIRLRNRSTYNIVGIGTHFMGLDTKFSGALFYRLGQYFQLGPRWTLSGDIGYYHIETFQRHSTDKPERLYSLEARVNADYQISKRLGAFVSVGYGDTRYYNHAKSYRSRPLVEAGLTMRPPRGLASVRKAVADDEEETGDSVMALTPRKHPWKAAAEATGINVLVHCFDRFVTSEEFAQTTLRSIRRNFTDGLVWDNDVFITNMFAHPYHGNLYFNSARSNGLSFWESAPYALGGSLMWEFLGETEPPAVNDLIATSMGGIAIGEITHRISNVVLNDRSRGFRRFLREAAATIIDPMKGFNRLLSGDAWRVRHDHHLYHDRRELPLDFSVSTGYRYVADDGSLFRGEPTGYVTLYLGYGNPVDGETHTTPYDFFDVEANFGIGRGQPLVNALHIVGRLWSKPVLERNGMACEFGIYQHFNYYDSKPVADGTELTPYRISEAGAVGPGFIFSLPKVGAMSRLEQRVFIDGILLGGTKSDYFNVIERDYNMGSGFSVKSKTLVEFGSVACFVLHAKYFHLFTWKGYEEKDLNNVSDLHYLNVQGDRGDAELLVINPIMEVGLRKNWSLNISGSFFYRHTHYKYHPDVTARTFEAKVGLTCHL
ncbi:MAG: DUF3943 domain-containing protein [Prevotella sp.]|nr:DUF3943 domain-containing protein [Prevotella sp.]